MTLFAITRLNDTMLEVLLHEILVGPILVLTDVPETAQVLSSKYGINPILLGDSISDIRKRDRQFATDFMPGEFGEETFPDSSLPLWEVLSLDRLKFWWNASVIPDWSDFIFDLDPGLVRKTYISYDTYSPLPWVVADVADGLSSDIVAVQIGYIGDEEIQTAIHYKVDEVIVFSEVAEKLLNDAGGIHTRLLRQKDGTRKTVEDLGKEELRKSLGVPAGMVLAGLIYDKRDDFRALSWVMAKPPNMRVLIYPSDPRSLELANKAFAGAANITVLPGYETMPACDYVIAFRDPAQYPMSHLISLPEDITEKLGDDR